MGHGPGQMNAPRPPHHRFALSHGSRMDDDSALTLEHRSAGR